MSEPFIGEVRMIAMNFEPRGWAFCDGTLLAISQNTALFSILGTTYGGDGRTTFGLPDLRGRAVMHPGSGPGLPSRRLGERGGVDTVTLTENQMPSHKHTLKANPSPGEHSGPSVPTGANALGRSVGGNVYGFPANLVELAGASLLSEGGGAAHTNRQPYLVVNFVIALIGVYPPRS
jgi:microcystin-dependent protein